MAEQIASERSRQFAGLDIAFNSLYVFNGIWAPHGNPPKVSWTLGGTPVLAVSGGDIACVSGTVICSELFLPFNRTITGIGYLIGSVGGTDKVVASLYDYAGAILGYSAIAGSTVGTTATFQNLALLTAVAAKTGKYYIGLCFNGTTAKFRAYTIAGALFEAWNEAQTFGTPAVVTPPGTFTADKGPMAYVY